MNETFDLHKAYIENMRSVDTALTALLDTGRRAIRERNDQHLREITRASLLMLGVKLENRLGTILYHPGGFAEEERQEIRGASVTNAWTLLIDIGFRRRTNRWHLNVESLGAEQHDRHERVRNAVVDQLVPIVVVRNRLAHGQWETVLNAKETGPNPELEASIRSESILTIKLKDTLSGHLGRVIEDLVITRDAFERDFATSYGVFESTLLQLERADFDSYCTELRTKYDKGRIRRASAND
jgi:hypothetical protein